MSKPNIRSQRAKEMKAVVEKYHSSGLTPAHFCKQENFSVSAFKYWLRRTRLQDDTPTKSAQEFFPLKVKAADSGARLSNCTIELPGGVLIYIYEPVNPDLILKLINGVR